MDGDPFSNAAADSGPTVCVTIAFNSGNVEDRTDKEWGVLFEIPLHIANGFRPFPYRWLLLYTCHILGLPESEGSFTHLPENSHDASDNAINMDELSISLIQMDPSVERLLQGPRASAAETSYVFLQANPVLYNFLPPSLLRVSGRAKNNVSSAANSTVSSASRQSERIPYLRSRSLLRDNGDPFNRQRLLFVHPHIEARLKITAKSARSSARNTPENEDVDWKRIEPCLSALPPDYEVQLHAGTVTSWQSFQAAHLFPFAGNPEDFLYLARVRGQLAAADIFCINDPQNAVSIDILTHVNYDGFNAKPAFAFMPIPASFQNWPLPQDESELTFPQVLEDNPEGRPVFFVVHYFGDSLQHPSQNTVGVWGDSPVASMFAGPPRWLLEYIAGARFLSKFGKRALWESGNLRAAGRPSEEVLLPIRKAMQAAEEKSYAQVDYSSLIVRDVPMCSSTQERIEAWRTALH